MGIDVESPDGCMVVDIGGGTTEIAVISLGGIVTNKSIKIAGDDFNADIVEYMGRMHNIRIDEPTAERIKIAVGSALPELDDPLDDFMVIGPNKVTALPMQVPISYQEGTTGARVHPLGAVCRYRAAWNMAHRRWSPAAWLG